MRARRFRANAVKETTPETTPEINPVKGLVNGPDDVPPQANGNAPKPRSKKESIPKTLVSTNDKMAKLTALVSDMSITEIESLLRQVPVVKKEDSMFPSIPNFNIPNHLLIPGETVIERITNALQARLPNYLPQIMRRRNTWKYKPPKKQPPSGPICFLDEKCAQIDYIPGLNNSLYPHQKVVCLAMYMLEQARSIKLNYAGNGDIPPGEYILNCSAAVLSDTPGSGKTIDLIGLIMLSKVPRLVANITQIPYMSNPVSGYIRSRIKKNLLKPTIIFVGRSVLGQWLGQIKTFTQNKSTDLKIFMVGNVYDLEKLLRGMVTGAINEYDIVLVKNGDITAEIDFPFNDHVKKTPRSIYNNIARMTDYMWARMIIDDFDTIGLKRDALAVNAIFTWFVSSTIKKMAPFRNEYDQSLSILQNIKNGTYGCSQIMNNKLLFEVFNLRCSKQFRDSVIEMPHPKFMLVKIKDAKNNVINMIAQFDNDKVARIVEALNGDAIEEAARIADIQTNFIADVFDKLLKNNKKQYIHACAVLEYIEFLRTQIPKLLDYELIRADEPKTYTMTDLSKCKPVKYLYPDFERFLNEATNFYKGVCAKTGGIIEKIKETIRNGTCEICQEPFSEKKAVMLERNCGALYCNNCGIHANRLINGGNLGTGRCALCQRNVTLVDFMVIDTNNLDRIAEVDIEDKEEIEEKKAELAKKQAIEEKQAKKKNAIFEGTKYEALVKIVNGEPIDGSVRVDMVIPTMVKGTAYMKDSPVKKVLVFANFEETLAKVIETFKTSKIKYWRLMGTAKEISEVVNAFTEYKGTCALVINSVKNCSGLNLQAATDLVYTHTIQEMNIEGQVAGRAFRLGRKNALTIWYLQFVNELENLCRTHNVRNLSDEELKFEAESEEKWAKGQKIKMGPDAASPSVDDEEKPKKSSRKKSAGSDEDEDEEDKEDKEPENEDEEDEEKEDEEKEDEEEEEEKTTRKTKAKKPVITKNEDEDDEPPEDEDDEPPEDEDEEDEVPEDEDNEVPEDDD